jgi:hypothetical protein
LLNPSAAGAMDAAADAAAATAGTMVCLKCDKGQATKRCR